MKSRKKIYIVVLLVIGTLLLLNYLSTRFFTRLDLTEDNRYTLSKATKEILKNIDEPVTVTAYYSENLPPQLDQIKREFRDLLTEYSNYSKGMLAYEFIDPLKDEKTQSEAQQAGVQQIQVQVREKDQMKAQVAFMGARIQMGEASESLPIIQSSSGLEYQLSSTIKKLSVKDKPSVGFIQGHGEPGFGKIWQAKRPLDVLYKTELVYLNDSNSNLNQYKTLVLIGPTDSIPIGELNRLSEYLSNGGRMFVALNRANCDLTKTQTSNSVNTGLETWLVQKGVEVNDNLVIDQSCMQIGVQTGQGFVMPVGLPYFIKVNSFGDHPVSEGLESVILQFASSIDFSGDSSLHYTPLLQSSDLSGTKPADGYIDVMQQWATTDFPVSKLTLAAALEGVFGHGLSTKMVVVGDADFPISEGQQNQLNPDNVNLLVNSIDWLSDDTGLVELRTQGATARPLDELEDSKRTLLKYLNFLLPMLLALGYGIFRIQQNRRIRERRKEVGYV